VSLRSCNERIPEDRVQEIKIIVKHIREHKKISRKECVELLGVSPTTSFRYFRSLEKRGVIKERGRGKSSYYVLV